MNLLAQKTIQKFCFDVSLKVIRSLQTHSEDYIRAADSSPLGMRAWKKQVSEYNGHADQEVCIIMSQVLNEND